MSLGSVLNTASSALAAQQVVMSTIGQNIANAQTDGYSRQTVQLTESVPQRFTYGIVGTGVTVAGVTSARDQMLDRAVYQASSGESGATQRQNLLSSVQDVLGEPSDTGLASTLDAFWSSWSDLAAQPSSSAAKAVVVQRGTAVASTLNQFTQRLDDLRTQTTASLDVSLKTVNGLAQQIATLNGQIVAAQSGGQSANDLVDARARAIQQLSALGSVQALPAADGSVQVTYGSYTLVAGIHARQLQRTTDVDGNAALAFTDQPGQPLQATGGSVQATLDFLNTDARGVQDQLDAIANTLATTVNGVVAQGQNASGTSAAPFFVNKVDGTFAAGANPYATPPAAGAVNATTIAINPALVADASGVPTSSSAQQPSNNDVALALAQLRTSPTSSVGGVSVTFTLPDRTKPATTVGGVTTPATIPPSAPTTFADFYNATVTSVGANVQAATSDAGVQSTLANQARTRRDGTTGVNTDEEMTNLMQAQQAYSAAAKVVTTVNEMMQSLLEMV